MNWASDRMNGALVFLPAVLVVGAVAGCGDADQACTLIGCVDGLTVGFSEALDAEQPVTLRFELDDGEIIECETRFGEDTDAAPCAQVDVGALHVNGGLLDVHLYNRHPRELRFQVLRGAEVLVNVQPTVEYTTSEPNGPGCGVCEHGVLAITTPSGSIANGPSCDAGTEPCP